MVIVHMFYNYLLLPLLRDKYKYKLFSLRDEFRRYELENKGEINPELIDYFKHTVNKTINMVEIFDFSIIFMVMRALKTDDRLQEVINEYNNLFNNYATDEIKNMEQRKLQIAMKIFYANTIESAICILPFCIVGRFVGYSFKKINELVNKFVNLPA